MRHAPRTADSRALALVAAIIGLLALVVVPARPAEAAACCTVTREGTDLHISGNLYHRGTKVITWSLQDGHGHDLAGLHCASYRIDAHHDHAALTIPVKYVPNGRWRMVEHSANSDYTRYFDDPGPWFDVTQSPAVDVDVTKPAPNVSRVADVKIGFYAMGAIAKVQCRLDGATWSRCQSPAEYLGLKDGAHTFNVRVIGKNADYTKQDGDRFKVDTQPPTAPNVAGAAAGWTSYGQQLTASGSTDAGAGVARYQSRKSVDGGTTWSAPAVGSQLTISRQGTTVVEFRAVDKIGRVSGWTRKTVRIDGSQPGAPTVTPGPCSVSSYPVTLSASAVDVGAAGIDHYVWQVNSNAPQTADSVQVDEGSVATVYAVDRANNPGNSAFWNPGTC